MPVRVLREVIGEKTPLHLVTKHHIEKVCDVLRRVPLNAAQRYPGLPVQKAIEAAERAKDVRILSERTVANYYILILAVFNYAREDGLIGENPAKTRKLRELFRQKSKKVQRSLFTPDELTAIFQAPLYIGCKDDGNGFAKPGTNKPRGGRFWLPLLALFHGFRSNEAAQLYVEDVAEEGGITYFQVRAAWMASARRISG